MAKSGRLELGDNITDIIGLYSTTVTYLTRKAIEFGEKRKIRAITPFKVIQGYRGRYQSKAHATKLTAYLVPLRSFAAYCSNFGHCVFEPPFGGA